MKNFLFVLVALFCSCETEDVIILNPSYIGPADLIITNLITGEVRQNTASVIINPTDDCITFRHGETLQLKFTPPEEYKKNKFTVNFQVLDIDTNVVNSPYIYEITLADDVPVGTYIATCSAMCEEWNEQSSSCKQSIAFRVEK